MLLVGVCVAAGIVAGARVLPVLAQGTRLHEQVFGLEDGAVLRFTRAAAGGANVAGAASPADGADELLFQNGALIEKPTGVPGGEAMRSDSGGLGQDRGSGASPRFRPDRITSFGSESNYYSSFAPSVSPHKRLSALDAVVMDGSVPVLVVGDGSRSPVSVTEPSASDSLERDRFWGNVTLDFSKGLVVPIPSVAPTARILALETDPPVTLHIEKDTADNFFAVLEDAPEPGDTRGAGEIRLTFLTDAPVEYFNAERIPNTAAGVLGGKVAPLPSPLRRRVVRFLEELGLRSGVSYRSALERLTEHFRSFQESEESPAIGESIFLDLARSGRGVCRHRAYAFVISAMQLGIPARFVMNEAHAWVEVEVPESGWIRIDLGGAITDFHDQNPSARVHYESRYQDPLPRPEPYRVALARSRGSGESAGGWNQGGDGTLDGDLQRTTSQGSLEPTVASTGDPQGPEAVAAAERSAAAEATPAADGMMSKAPVTHPDFGTAADPEAGSATTSTVVRVPVRLRLNSLSRSVFRGATVSLSGQLVAPVEVGPPAGLRVEVTLLDPHGGRTWPLGVAVTGADGAFAGSFGVAPDIPVGNYRIRVRSVESERFLAAEAH